LNSKMKKLGIERRVGDRRSVTEGSDHI
jgi:hypothetical protein